MKEHYTYLDIYGTPLYESKSERIYFVSECEYHSFYKWVFQHGQNIYSKKHYKLNGVSGYKVTIKFIPTQ